MTAQKKITTNNNSQLSIEIVKISERDAKMKYYGMTDCGIVRSENQDTFGCEEIKLKCTGETLLLSVVCDGMGGASGGALASSTAESNFMKYVLRQIEAYGEDISNPDNIPFEKILGDGVKFANKAVLAESTANPEYEGMGTTLVAMLCAGNSLYVVNVGDSRMYALCGSDLVQITHDHSFVQSLVDNGTITKEQARTHPEKNIILQAVGTSTNIKPDIFTLKGLPEAALLCSDGLSNMLPDSEIGKILCKESSCEEIAAELTEAANTAGGTDNITVFVAKFDTASEISE